MDNIKEHALSRCIDANQLALKTIMGYHNQVALEQNEALPYPIEKWDDMLVNAAKQNSDIITAMNFSPNDFLKAHSSNPDKYQYVSLKEISPQTQEQIDNLQCGAYNFKIKQPGQGI